MGYLARVISGGVDSQRRAAAFSEDFWPELGLTSRSKAGTPVTAETALKVATVFACLRVKAEGFAQVPLKIFKKRTGGGSDTADTHPLHWLLYRQPNSWQTSFDFRQTLVLHAELTGRFVAFKNMAGNKLMELVPIEPSRVRTQLDEYGGLRFFLQSKVNGEEKEFPPEAIWHVPGPSWNGQEGMALLSLAREAIGLSIATEESHALMHANGVQTQGVYSVDRKLDEKQFKQLRNWIDSHNVGANRFKPMVLDNAGKWIQTSMNGVDAQHLETRKHQIYEICSFLRVLPIMLGIADKTVSYQSAEQMFIAHVVHTLDPLWEKVQQSIDVNLLGREAFEQGYYSKFISNALLRGAARDRGEFFWKMWQMGALNSNEIRAFEEMNPYEGGEVYRIPVNTAPNDGSADDAGSDPSLANRMQRVNVGRVLSGKNEKRIRDADGLLNEVLADLGEETQE